MSATDSTAPEVLDKLTTMNTLEATFGGPRGKVLVTYELLQKLCPGGEPEAVTLTPSIRCCFWRGGKRWPSYSNARARIVAYERLAPGETIEIEPHEAGTEGTVLIVPMPKGSGYVAGSRLPPPHPRRPRKATQCFIGTRNPQPSTESQAQPNGTP